MRMLFCLLLFSSTVFAQSFYFPGDSAVVSSVDLPATEPFDTAKSYFKVKSRYVYIISDKDLYDHFGYNVLMKFSKFDFTNFHILGSLQCMQCLIGCNHHSGERNCHRNVCMRKWVWVKRDNKKAFTAVPSYTQLWHKRNDLPMYNDTVIVADGDTSRWYTTGHGDCFAHFEYDLVTDKYHHALILKERNYWGGCRAGGSKEATIVFKEPEGILYKTKRTILMEKRQY